MQKCIANCDAIPGKLFPVQDVILVMLLCYQPQLLENTIYEVQSPKLQMRLKTGFLCSMNTHFLKKLQTRSIDASEKTKVGSSLLWTFQPHFLLAHPDKVDTKVTWR